MKSARSTLLTLSLTVALSSTAFAGNIGGMRTTSAGNIGGMRTTSAGNIGGMRTDSTGNIGGMRTNSLGNIGGLRNNPAYGSDLSSIDIAGNIGGLIALFLSGFAAL
jgi:hypothetical protein